MFGENTPFSRFSASTAACDERVSKDSGDILHAQEEQTIQSRQQDYPRLPVAAFLVRQLWRTAVSDGILFVRSSDTPAF